MAISCELADVTAQDIPAILALERDSFPLPWQRDSFVHALERPQTIFLALHALDLLVGYSLSWLVVDELHILKVAVCAEHRQQGLATRLLEETIRRAREQNVVTAWLEVRPSNAAARALYARCGFQEVFVRRKYYTDTNEDAIILARMFRPGEKV